MNGVDAMFLVEPFLSLGESRGICHIPGPGRGLFPPLPMERQLCHPGFSWNAAPKTPAP